MNELWAKLTNFSYELFGIIFPGLVVSIFLVIWWAALGPFLPYVTGANMPEFSIAALQQVIDKLTLATGISIIVPMFIIWYFLGNVLQWFARGGRADPEAEKRWLRRTWLSLTFRIPKPVESFDNRLRPLFDAVAPAFQADGVILDWRTFYPVAKSHLFQHLSYSLVATYQNKYTFHRSITAASALLFLLSMIGIAAGMLARYCGFPGPNWAILIASTVVSPMLVWGFSGSYLYNWKMFGDTIVTESYALLKGPKNAKPADERPAAH
jgi:hypothetical protein